MESHDSESHCVKRPGTSHRGAFRRDWNHALKALHGERKAHSDENRCTWHAIGYRHGMRNRTEDETAIEEAWEWSKREGLQHLCVNVARFTADHETIRTPVEEFADPSRERTVKG